jgi:hypothetical protein
VAEAVVAAATRVVVVAEVGIPAAVVAADITNPAPHSL